MIGLAVSALLYAMLAWLIAFAARRRDGTLRAGLRGGLGQFLTTLPRLTIAMLSAGFVAELLPNEEVARWLGGDSGVAGLLIGLAAGALTPGGPVVGYSIASAAARSGAAFAPVVAYLTAWSLFGVSRLVTYELAVMPPAFVRLRALASLPLALLAGALALGLARLAGG